MADSQQRTAIGDKVSTGTMWLDRLVAVVGFFFFMFLIIFFIIETEKKC